MLEELRVQMRELTRLTSEARVQAQTTKEKSQRNRAARQARRVRQNRSRPKSKS